MMWILVCLAVGAVIGVLMQLGYRSEQREWEERWKDYIE